MLRTARHVHQADRDEEPRAGGRRGAQLRRQRPNPARGPFENIWIQPAAGDAGGALGVALFIWHQLLDNPRQPHGKDSQKGSLLGPQYSDEEIAEALDAAGAVYDTCASDEHLCDEAASLLASEKVIGWFPGRMEFGPRALGNRSILGDARSPAMQSVMNLKIKFRESFRPFAPIVLREHVHEYFDMRPNEDSPYMLLVAPVREAKRLEPGPGHDDAFRYSKAELSAFGDPGRHARRSLGPHSNGRCRAQSPACTD